GYIFYLYQGALVARRIDLATLALGDAITVTNPVGFDAGINAGAFSVATGIVAHRSAGPGKRRFMWFDRSGRNIGAVGPVDPDSPNYLELSPDDHQIAFDRTMPNNRDVWIADASGNGIPSRFTFSPTLDGFPVWSADGKRIFFRSNRKGLYDLYEKSVSLSA